MKTNQIIAVVGLIAAVGFGVMPLQQKVNEQKELNSRLSITKQKQIEQVAQLEKIAAAGSHEKYIPDGPAELAFANDLKRIGKKNGITVPASWSFSTNFSSDVGAEQISVSFPIQGRRQQIANFLSDIEANPRFMGVKSFAITSDPDASLGLTKMSVEIYGFFLSEK